MRIDHIGINVEIAKQVERIVSEEVLETMPIKQLTCWGKLPLLNVPWTEWLLYSILNVYCFWKNDIGRGNLVVYVWFPTQQFSSKDKSRDGITYA